MNLPEDRDTTSGQRQAQNWLGYSDRLEAELAAETQRTVTHERDRHDWPTNSIQIT
jgi:hypothetical protein